jgi:hypothetical protein
LLYNKADKDKEGWSVYSAAKELLKVVEDLWADASLEITERARRREVLRKERERAQQKRRQEEIALEKDKERKWMEEHERRMQEQKVQEALVEQKMEEDLEKSSFRAQQIDTGANRKLQLTIKQNMNKSERKAEEKRRKRARREEEIARSEKRRRTAVAATDDALREAEMRSRRRIQKLEIVAAIRLREARESKSKEEESRRELLTKVKFDPSKWNGKLRVAGLSKLLWLRKHRKMQIDVPDFFKSIEG